MVRWRTGSAGNSTKSCSDPGSKPLLMGVLVVFGVGCLGDWGWESHDC